jgi:hypothetical protein
LTSGDTADHAPRRRFRAERRWQPEPSWPPAPEGWQLLVEDPTTAPLETPPELQDAFRVTSGYDQFAIASLACSILGSVLFGIGFLLGIGFGIVALRRIRRSRAMGRGLAIAGISISVVLLSVATVIIGIGLTRGRSPQDEAASRGLVYLADLRTGDCLMYPSNVVNLFTVEATTCTAPHDAQVIHTFQATPGQNGGYPGNTALEKQADLICTTRALNSLDPDLLSDTLEVFYFYPSPESWDPTEEKEQSVQCLVRSDSITLTQSLLP